MPSGRNKVTPITTSGATDERTSFKYGDMGTLGLKCWMFKQGLCHAAACDSGSNDYKVCLFRDISGLDCSYSLVWRLLPERNGRVRSWKLGVLCDRISNR
jgi:hypothetical protein